MVLHRCVFAPLAGHTLLTVDCTTRADLEEARDDPMDSQRTILAACNHSAYARSCVRMKLHELMLYCTL